MTKVYKLNYALLNMTRHLSNKEKKEINKILVGEYTLNKKDEVTESDEILYKNKEKYLLITEKNKKQILKVVPHLKSIIEAGIKSVYIDNGAIPFLIKGADMMRPGITEIEDEINSGDTIFIRDAGHKKVLAVGIAVATSEELRKQEKGIVAKTIHYMGDKYY